MRALHYVRGRSCAARPQAGCLRVCVSANISMTTCVGTYPLCMRKCTQVCIHKCACKGHPVTRARKITLREVELASFLSPHDSLARSLCLSLSILPCIYHRLSHYLSLHLSLSTPTHPHTHTHTHAHTQTHKHTTIHPHHLSASLCLPDVQTTNSGAAGMLY
jgi:hypothetical protein